LKGHRQPTQELRYQIEILKKAGKNQKDIAELANVSPSTVCRELRRNTGKRGYRPKQAQIKADNRRKQTAKPLKMTAEAIDLIDSKIVIEWGAEQISGWLEEEEGLSIGHGRIYRPIWADKLAGGTLHQHLRHSGKKRTQYGLKDKRGQIRQGQH
jgi:IS30 family transposase